jgi:hypothetical protein
MPAVGRAGPAWCPYQDSNLDWTGSEPVASTEIGLQGRGASPGSRTPLLPLTRRLLCQMSLRGTEAVRCRGVEPRLAWLSTRCLCRLG